MSMASGPPSGPGLPAAAPLPSWLGPIVQITTTLGVPTVFAGVLLWFVLAKVGGTLEVIQQQEMARTEIVAEMQAGLVAALERQTNAFEQAINRNIEANKLLSERYQRPPPH